MSFSETSMSSSSSPKITSPGSDAVTLLTKSLKSIDSFRTNKDDFDQDGDVNESNDSHFIKSETRNKPISPTAHSFQIPEIRITPVESCESEHFAFEKPDTIDSSSNLTFDENEPCILTSKSTQIEKGFDNSEAMIDQMIIPKIMSLNLNGVNENGGQLEVEVTSTVGDETTAYRKSSSERKRKVQCFTKTPKLHKEVSLTDYHKYVARKTLLDTLRRRHVPIHKQYKSSNTIDKSESIAISKKKRKSFKNLISSKKRKSNSYFNIHFPKDNENQNKIEANDKFTGETCSLKQENEATKQAEFSITDKIDAPVTLLNNTRRFSFQQLKDQSKSAISTFQKFIEVTFDRGKSG